MYVYILYIMCVFLLTFDANDDDDDDSVVIYESPGSRLVTCYFFALFYCRCILYYFVHVCTVYSIHHY